MSVTNWCLLLLDDDGNDDSSDGGNEVGNEVDGNGNDDKYLF
jgi:hypothetical protein